MKHNCIFFGDSGRGISSDTEFSLQQHLNAKIMIVFGGLTEDRPLACPESGNLEADFFLEKVHTTS